MAKQLTSKNTILFSTGGAPVPADVVTTANDVIVNPSVTQGEYKDIGNGVPGSTKGYNVPDLTTVEGLTIETKVRGGGAAGIAPEIAELLKACSLTEIITAITDVVYAPSPDSVTGVAKIYLDGSYRDVTGVAMDMSLSGKIGEQAMFSFSLKGFTTLIPTVEANPAVTLDTSAPLLVVSASAITVGGGTVDLTSFDFALGNDISQSYGTSTKDYDRIDFKPTIKVNAIKTKANEQHWIELTAGTPLAIAITLGSVAGQIVVLNIPLSRPTGSNESDDSGKIVFENTYMCEASGTGGDNFSLTFK